MLLSMTGHGDARHQSDGYRVSVEIRTVNSRYLKVNVRGPESNASLEAKIESLIRAHVQRGTVNVSLKIQRELAGDEYRINTEVLHAYRRQLLENMPDVTETQWLPHLLQLPGVVEEPQSVDADGEQTWRAVKPAVVMALESLRTMRAAEGAAMAEDLRSNIRFISEALEQIEQQAPKVVENYRSRLADRLSKLLKEYKVTVTDADIVREVGIFCERCDISEEIVRLRSHLEQFEKFSAEAGSSGRKLEFLIQEMFREINTIGSKANDALIAIHVVEAKTCVERMREQIQNVE